MNLQQILINLKLNVFIQTTKRIKFYYSYPNLGFIDTILFSIFYDIVHRIHISKLLNSKITFDIQGVNWIDNKEFSTKFEFILDDLNTPKQIQEILDKHLEINGLGIVNLNKIKIIIEYPSDQTLGIKPLFLSPIYNLLDNLIKK
jgi:hypothetical protein